MTLWNVWTDGSCKHPQPQTTWTRGFGGWCAIVEHDHDGWVLRGREPETTNVRMELRAMIEGLRSLPDDVTAVLHVDCTVVYSVVDALERGLLDRLSGRDSPLWRELGDEMSLRTVAVDLLGKGQRDERHRRAHVFAGGEARAGLLEMPENATPLSTAALSSSRKARRRRAAARTSLAVATTPQQGVRAGAVRLRHLDGCTNAFCMYGCPIWRYRHPGIHGPPIPGY